MRNLSDCLQKIRDMIAAASVKAKQPKKTWLSTLQIAPPLPTVEAVALEARMLIKHTNRINRSGELIVTGSEPVPDANLSDCLQKIRDMIAAASVKHKQPSQKTWLSDATGNLPGCDIAVTSWILDDNRIDKMNRERLQQKKMHTAVKRSRRVEFD
ncbi:peptidyl-tRNA hydrolase ICT1 [Huso huso]|uniref:Peptidyl-tRNA hydrolase ICT1 n=1 Tax=Huso huso TaxID=61971 RepID=A0ABR0Z177_HUSHU